MALIREQQGAVPAIGYDSGHRGGFSMSRLVAPQSSPNLALLPSRSGLTKSVSAPVGTRFEPMKKKDPPVSMSEPASKVMSARDPNTDGVVAAKEFTPLEPGFAKKPQSGQSLKAWGIAEVAGWMQEQNLGGQNDEYAAR